MSLVLGVDPGKGGAFAMYHQELGLLDVWDMPTHKVTVNKRVRTHVDGVGLLKLFEEAKRLGVDLTVLEGVGGRPRQSASNAYVFGYGVGMIFMASIAARIPVETADAAMWKVLMRVTPDPDQIRQRAIEEFGPRAWWQSEHKRKGKYAARHDRCEAALIAKFGIRMLGRVRPDADWRMVYKNANIGA